MYKIYPTKINKAALDDIADKVPSMFFENKPDHWQEDDVLNLCTGICKWCHLHVTFERLEKAAINELKREILEDKEGDKANRKEEKALAKMLAMLKTNKDLPGSQSIRNIEHAFNDAIMHCRKRSEYGLPITTDSPKVGRPAVSIAVSELKLLLSKVLLNAGEDNRKERSRQIEHLLKEHNLPLSSYKTIEQYLINHNC